MKQPLPRPPLGDLPVVVLSSGPAATEAQRQTRDVATALLGFLSSNTDPAVENGNLRPPPPSYCSRSCCRSLGDVESGTAQEDKVLE